jgi:hypothetical protein
MQGDKSEQQHFKCATNIVTKHVTWSAACSITIVHELQWKPAGACCRNQHDHDLSAPGLTAQTVTNGAKGQLQLPNKQQQAAVGVAVDKQLFEYALKKQDQHKLTAVLPAHHITKLLQMCCLLWSIAAVPVSNLADFTRSLRRSTTTPHQYTCSLRMPCLLQPSATLVSCKQAQFNYCIPDVALFPQQLKAAYPTFIMHQLPDGPMTSRLHHQLQRLGQQPATVSSINDWHQRLPAEAYPPPTRHQQACPPAKQAPALHAVQLHAYNHHSKACDADSPEQPEGS